jgi:hypothetical protein
MPGIEEASLGVRAASEKFETGILNRGSRNCPTS